VSIQCNVLLRDLTIIFVIQVETSALFHREPKVFVGMYIGLDVYSLNVLCCLRGFFVSTAWRVFFFCEWRRRPPDAEYDVTDSRHAVVLQLGGWVRTLNPSLQKSSTLRNGTQDLGLGLILWFSVGCSGGLFSVR
jgi:hypothetical protein